MPGFLINGSGTPAPTTVFFGKVPDRLSVLQRAYFDRPNGIIQYPAQGPADLVSKWTLYNQNQNSGSNVPTASFGATTLAPDGTNNGTKLVESATNTIHAVVSVFKTLNSFGNFQLRLSVFAKAAERTRFAMSINDSAIDAGSPAGFGSGCITVFDLAGGQIGVANTAYGSANLPFVPKGQEIVSFGNGWYRCTMDVQVGQCVVGSFYGFAIEVDNGSGTGAISNTYTGNGTSGVYFWRSTCLPPKAWGLNTVTLFDDFTSLSTIDLNNTKAPYFYWYVDPNWPNYLTGLSITGAANYSIIGGTVLKQDATVGGVDFVLPISAVSTGGTGWNGFVFKTPALVEASIATENFIPGFISFWTHSLAFLLSANPPNGWHVEDDWYEYPPGGGLMPRNTFAASQDNVEAFFDAWPGVLTWNASLQFPGGANVSFGGSVYNAPTTPTIGVAPPNSTWVLVSPQPQSFTSVDFTQQHVTSILWLPAGGVGDAGQILSFFDGAYVPQAHFIYGRQIFNTPGPGVPSPLPVYFFTGDGLPMPIILETQGTGGPAAAVSYWDFVRVTQ